MSCSSLRRTSDWICLTRVSVVRTTAVVGWHAGRTKDRAWTDLVAYFTLFILRDQEMETLYLFIGNYRDYIIERARAWKIQDDRHQTQQCRWPEDCYQSNLGFHYTEQCHSLIAFMPRRIDAVIHAKGGPTKYWVYMNKLFRSLTFLFKISFFYWSYVIF